MRARFAEPKQRRLVAFLLFLCAASSHAEVARDDAFVNYREGTVDRSVGSKRPWQAEEVSGVALISKLGTIRLQLRREWAPKACEAVARFVASQAGSTEPCEGCSWYRHEPAPENWGVDGFWGPPYGLLQGGVHSLGSGVEQENPGGRAVMRGTAAFIAGSSDFFIGTVDHTEWGASFTPFAQVQAEDMAVVLAMPQEPYRNSTDPQYHFVTRWLLETVPFRVAPLTAMDLRLGAGAGGGAVGAAM